MEKGYLALVLHTHLPYVRHPEYDYSFEENWYFEALTETYVPLLNVFEQLVADNIDFRVTMSLTPPLVSMMCDPFLQSRYQQHINKLIELADKEVDRTRWQSEFQRLALMYHWKFTNAKQVVFEKWGGNLLPAFKRLQDLGKLEIITCGATHGYLPLMNGDRSAARAQVNVAVNQHERWFEKRPRGIWLPECGYEPGIDEILKEFGIQYFFLETHGMLFASPRPKFGVFAPVYCPSGVAAFSRDVESSKQVWSSHEGYPGDCSYRDFYRDIGFDLDYEYVRPYFGAEGSRVFTGIKYYRITGRTDDKQPYQPEKAQEKAAEHAGNFMFNREKQVEYLHSVIGRKPIVVSPYDAELFGHWWYEGPDWINFLIRKIFFDQRSLKLITPSEYLKEYPTNQVTVPCGSSWGWKGYHETWLEANNDWIYPHLHKAASRMGELARQYHQPDPLTRRALNQAAREVLLAQSSDWAFIMKTGTVIGYAAQRTKNHVARFNRIYHDLNNGFVDTQWLSEVETHDNIFPEIDYRAFA